MHVVLEAIRELRAAEAKHVPVPGRESFSEIVGLLSGATLGSALWLLLLHLTWFS